MQDKRVAGAVVVVVVVGCGDGGGELETEKDTRLLQSAGPTDDDAPLRSALPGEKVRFRNVTAVIVPDGIIGEKTPHPSSTPALSPLRADDGGGGGWKSNRAYFAPRKCSAAFPYLQ